VTISGIRQSVTRTAIESGLPRAPARPVRPRDAASLILHRGHGERAEILLGRRDSRDRFMPDVYVFPGGRVDASDVGRSASTELRPEVASLVQQNASPARARALGVACVRETFEETGLVVGRMEAGELRADLRRLDFVARAITPAMNPIRYHARFFLADAEHAHGDLRGNGELHELGWLRVADALQLNIIDVTAFVLQEVAARLGGRPVAGVPLIHYRGVERHIRRSSGPATSGANPW
jgi:8-oxo-dGTP pyrophosphatase MutT (NUDIX family)